MLDLLRNRETPATAHKAMEGSWENVALSEPEI
jgi:hypothetical protein